MADKTNTDFIEIAENDELTYAAKLKVTKENDNNFRVEVTIRDDQYNKAKAVITQIVQKARLSMSIDNNPIYFNVNIKEKTDPFLLTGDLHSIKYVLTKYRFISEETLNYLNEHTPTLTTQATENKERRSCCSIL